MDVAVNISPIWM